MNNDQLIQFYNLLNEYFLDKKEVYYKNKDEMLLIDALYLRIGTTSPALLQVRLSNGLTIDFPDNGTAIYHPHNGMQLQRL